MVKTEIPGHGELAIRYLVLDYNGTLAVDGEPLPGVKKALTALSGDVEVHILTADTFGKVRSRMAEVPCVISVLPPGGQDKGKLDYITRLGPRQTACIGNGRNDRLMVKEAALGIAVILGEGASTETLLAADVVCTDILSALELLNHPLRLTATLRT
ncbi:MAG: ATPase P [Deltaproteobacteria bacterium]|nr:ATPase P [Deltaproteobacteria bacterium]MBW2130873.1 ATPase P [Deltaproteobacteria bacterium]MBW2302752.1 ATPase P [Deltaproteobacteria bacterium]